jgi:hypothetical protein
MIEDGFKEYPHILKVEAILPRLCSCGKPLWFDSQSGSYYCRNPDCKKIK